MKQILPLDKLALFKRFKQYKYVLLVIAVGLVLLLIPTSHPDEKSPQIDAQQSVQFDLEAFEHRLEQTLSLIEGAGKTSVVLTLKNDGMRVLAQENQRKEGESSNAVVTIGRGSGIQDVVEVQSFMPQYQGALVVCQGADSPAVQLKLIEAVSALTGLGADKISVCKGNE